MATTTLLLTHPSKDQSSIICQLIDGRGIRIRIPCALSVKSKHWSKKNNNVLSADPEAIEKNKALNSIKKRVLGVYLDSKEKGIIANAIYIKELLKPAEIALPANKEFWNVWNYYLEDRKGRFKPRSFDKFKYLKKHLIYFEEAAKIPWTLDNTTKKRLEKFQSYFYDINIGTQTTAKYIGVFKMFLNWAVENNYTAHQDYRSFKPIQQKDTLKVVLTPEEVEAIRKADLRNKGYLMNVRDLLILSTLTGLRYSDYSRIKQEHLKLDDEGEHYLQIRQEKTGDMVELPLIKEAVTIIQDLILSNIHAISNQKMNMYAKELCQLAEVNELCEVYKSRGKITATSTKPKYELITTHTGRRTFATNLLLKGVPPETVMQFTGHKDYKSFAKYVNIPKKTNMNLVKMALNELSLDAKMKISKCS